VGRRLGQHFLKSGAVERLLRVVDPAASETFLEIGAGGGALTRPLASRAGRVVAVEIDSRLAAHLRAAALPNVNVVEGDALTLELAPLAPDGARVVGNLPYYVSSPILRKVLELRGRVRDVHVMVQEEVAERIASPPGSKAYGVLSVLFGLFADLDIPLRFARNCFVPRPGVDSALLRVRFLPAPRAPIPDPQAFEQLVHRAFSRRRKTLENNLQDSYPNLKDHLRLLNIAGTRRAETLSVVEFAALSRALVLD
jgi:16S rRNA (adenine1518-N6/adenine1519-N6)-dimethyltransferase